MIFDNNWSITNCLSKFSICLDSVHLRISRLCVSFFFFFLFFFMHTFHYFKRYRVLFMHCSQDPQLLYSEKNIKNRFHDTIHTFKNYFTTVFSIFSKISCIQIDPKLFHYYSYIPSHMSKLFLNE